MSDQPITWDDRGLVPAIVQHHRTAEVLMMAWMDAEALSLTLSTGDVYFWSRSRRRLWKKGETSGNILRLVGIRVDCDRDTLVVRVGPAGPACHTGSRTCFEDIDGGDRPAPQGFADLEGLWQTIADRISSASATGSYTVRLAEGGPPATGRKLIEEASELSEAALLHQADRAGDRRVAEEAGDLVYHLLVLLAERGVSAREVIEELASRRRTP
ncbi:MAG: bifunctional phosphoribosyl-AMP cyclohydrolase/phosphoribosyl-ATP diphosphatase HisIE [Acidimicrobiia bacterium]|nr:bifunctional phosphoribosyl-AMP cyclohydrolase/phosphoribosyl-ATP diphosphatase HisIE [Acidimicrobiia bacterium]MYF84041.1 bifunctional phosphoribosyl-AMP cyclohydrolase/phosphoribosyl-ATP diphosphatase HisIE [Acidimicrobiia bacterium]